MIKRDDFHTQRYTPKLNASLALPSSIHGYTIAVGFLTQWFKRQFPQDFFKTVHVSGRHALDDFRRKLDVGEYAQRNKPALTIIPRINTDYTMDGVDTHLSGKDLLIRNFRIRESFLKDYENNIFLGVRLQSIEVSCNFRVRVRTRAQQIDCFQNIVLGCRVGATSTEFLTVDYHIPYNIMLAIAKDANFELKERINPDNGARTGQLEIANPIAFCKYLNEHSGVPFIYQYRSMNGRNEFFTRVRNVPAHISALDRPDVDDGEKIGMKNDNFMVELNVTLHLPVPYFFIYYSESDEALQVNTDNGDIGIYTIQYTEIPDETEDGWLQIVNTDRYTSYDEKVISLKPLIEECFDKPEVLKPIMDYCSSIGMSFAKFMKIRAWNTKELDIKVNYQTFDIILPDLPQTTEDTKIRFAIYMDMDFVNTIMTNMREG